MAVCRSNSGSLQYLALVFLLLTLCSCSGSSSHSNSSAGKPSDKDASAESKKDEALSAEKKIVMQTGNAATYPNAIPFAQYPGSTVTLSMVAKANQSVNLETGDSPDKAVTYYKGWFKTNNWKIIQQSSTSGLTAISAQNGNKLASIMSMPGAGAAEKSSIQITLTDSE